MDNIIINSDKKNIYMSFEIILFIIPRIILIFTFIFVNYYSENKIYNNKEISYNFFNTTSYFHSKYKNYITRKNSTIVTNGSPAKPRKYILCCFFHVISKKTLKYK